MADETKNPCDNCGKSPVTLRQFSPDFGVIHFCNEKCLTEYRQKVCYRATEAVWIETGKEIEYVVEKDAVCKGCGAPIMWVHMGSGKNMPVDKKLINLVTNTGGMIQGYMPHWATCTKAKNFKK